MLILDVELPGISGWSVGASRRDPAWKTNRDHRLSPPAIPSCGAIKAVGGEALMKPFDINRLVAVVEEAARR